MRLLISKYQGSEGEGELPLKSNFGVSSGIEEDRSSAMNSVTCVLSLLSSTFEAFYQPKETSDFAEMSDRTLVRKLMVVSGPCFLASVPTLEGGSGSS